MDTVPQIYSAGYTAMVCIDGKFIMVDTTKKEDMERAIRCSDPYILEEKK